MRHFLLRISVFVVAILGLLKVMEIAISSQLRASDEYFYVDFERAYSGNLNSDIVVLGSSRAFVHYDPSIIEDSTAMSCYNLAIDGGCQTMQFAIWKNLILNNEMPKVVVQNVEYLSFGKRKTLFEKERYLPYLEEPFFYDPLSLVDSALWQDKYVPMFRYHGQWTLIKDAITSFLGYAPRVPYDLNKGHKYKRQEFTGQEEINDFPLDPNDFELGMSLMAELVTDCEQNEIELILCYAPEYDNLAHEKNDQLVALINFYETVAKQNNHVVFWDMRPMNISTEKHLFADNYHMNEKGARIFSKEFASRLRKHLGN